MKGKKKTKGRKILSLLLALVIIIGTIPYTVLALAEGTATEAASMGVEMVETSDNEAVEATSTAETSEVSEATSTAETGEVSEATSTAETGEVSEATSTAETGEVAEATSTAGVGEDQETEGEASSEDEAPIFGMPVKKMAAVMGLRFVPFLSTFGMPVETTGYNLYSGSEVDTNNYIETYYTWTALIAAVKSQVVGEYSIDLYNIDLTPTTNWSTALILSGNSNTGNSQFSLHFYSTTQNKLTLSSGATMGAHVHFHAGLELVTPTAGNLGGYPLGSQTSSANDLRSGYTTNNINANGWKFIVDKGVTVTGAANLYAGTHGTSRFDYNKTVIDGISTGYLEINSGRWRYIGASTNIIYGSYRIIVGNNDDPTNSVHVDAVFGRRTGTMYPNITGPDIPSEYIEIKGNTIVRFGVACLINGSSGYDTTAPAYTTQKVVIGGNASVLSSWGGSTQKSLADGTNLQNGKRTSVTASAAGAGYGHYNSSNRHIVNLIVEIEGNAYIAGDVVGAGPNIYFNVNSESKGVHISIKDYAQVGGNVVYGGSSSARAVVPNDSVEDPYYTIDIIGAENQGDVKIGGHLLATNGQDNSSNSSWNCATTVINAEVNGSVFGYGNLAYEAISTGISIKRATITVENSKIGGGVYGVAAGRSGGSCQEIYITINKSSVGHVAPIFKFADGNTTALGNGNVTNYPLGVSSVEINDSIITGKTVMWRVGADGGSTTNLPTYSFVTSYVDNSGKTVKTPNLKAFAEITIDGTSREIIFNTDGYDGIELDAARPEISLTTSMNARASGGMDLANDSIGLKQNDANYPGKHTFTVTNTDFTRTNGNPRISIMDRGDGVLGTSAEVTVDNCYATTAGAKIDVAVFGTLTGTVTAAKIASMQMNLKNTNDLGEVGFAKDASAASIYIDTKATIVMDNTVVDTLFGKGGSYVAERIRNTAHDTNRVQFQFKNHNTITDVYANGADVVFTKDSVSYLDGKFNNTGATVFNKEYVATESGARVYFGNTGSAASRHDLGGAKDERIFGSISGTAGELYIYKDITNSNATYPIYVAQNGAILEVGMNLGEWTSGTGTLETAYENEELTRETGGVEFTITEPVTSKDNMSMQEEHDILVAFGTTANAVAIGINDIPLRPWPLVKYSDVNIGTTGEAMGWLILGKPRYQLIYRGDGVLEEDLSTSVSGKVDGESYIVKAGNDGGVDDYLYMLEENKVDSISYTIEGFVPIADADVAGATTDAYYTFLYWMLYSTVENAGDAAPTELLVPGNWNTVDRVLNSNVSDPNQWVANDTFELKELLTNNKLQKVNSKVLALVPVYRANYVCKIGNKGYLELRDAFAAINDGSAAAESDGSYVIKMLVETYEIKESYSIADGQDITITTAGEADTTFPYKGTEGTKATLLRYAGEDSEPGYSDGFFRSFGTLTLSDIILDGNKDQSAVSDSALIQVGGDAGKLNLLSGSVLQNNVCDGSETTASAIQCENEENLVYLKDTIIKDNVTIRPYDSVPTGAIVSGSVVLEGNVIVSDNYHEDSDDPDSKKKANICLRESILQPDDTYNNTAVRVVGTLAEGSDVGIRADILNHVDLYEIVKTESAAAALASMPFFHDDYDESLEIIISTVDPNNIMFKATVPFSFTKVKAENTSEILAGVEFKLYKLICEDTNHTHTDTTTLVTADNSGDGKCWELVDIYDSDEHGLVDFVGGLEKGTYMLVETKALIGYQLPAGQWQIAVVPSSSTDPITITAHGAAGDLPPAFMKEIDTDTDTTIYKLPNIKNLALPLSGLSGMRTRQILGALLAASAILLYIFRRRRNDKYRQTKN